MLVRLCVVCRIQVLFSGTEGREMERGSEIYCSTVEWTILMHVRKSEASMFSCTGVYSIPCTRLQVDLWSVGATFFHAATGRLPFQPYRKRDDRALM